MKKRALITGASEGIGREFARQLHERGYTLTLVARSEARLQTLITELHSNSEHKILCCDLSSAEGMNQVCQELEDTHYSLLVNNAGFGHYADFHEAKRPLYDQMIELNCTCLMRLSHVFLKNAASGDALLNVASVLAELPMAGSAVYNATKAFVKSFSETLWYEQRHRGVFVMALCPGMTRTEFFKRAGGTLDQSFPSLCTQKPQEVVRLALKELEERTHPVVVSGAFNRLSLFLPRFFSSKALIYCLGMIQSRAQRKDSPLLK